MLLNGRAISYQLNVLNFEDFLSGQLKFLVSLWFEKRAFLYNAVKCLAKVFSKLFIGYFIIQRYIYLHPQGLEKFERRKC